MRNFLLQMIRPFFAKKAVGNPEIIEKEKMVQFIKSLHPFQTQFDLIRLGPNGDGGYLVPDCLDDIQSCFSPGVSEVSGFELDCLNRGMKVFMADRSIEKPNWDVPEEKYSFQKKFIGCTNNEEFMTMDSWFQSTSLPTDAELLLQMDIEGAEYNAIINMSDELMKRFKIMVIEFHTLRHLWNKGFFRIAAITFKKILQTHICIHLHPNNFKGTQGSTYTRFGVEIPKVLEFTFLRKDIAEIKGYQTQFPHPLDFDNTDKAHFPLPKNWYRSKV